MVIRAGALPNGIMIVFYDDLDYARPETMLTRTLNVP
jgi:hypothetical protein